MKLWGPSQSKENQTETGGDEFERAAGQVSADLPADPGAVPGEMEAGEGESLAIRPEWAKAAAVFCFVPAARMVHPAYALSPEEAEIISPKMQAFLQAVADKYAPAALSRVANKYPEFLDLAGALGVLYWQKWRYVSKLREMEARERAEREAERKPGDGVLVMPPEPSPAPLKVGDRDGEGRLVI
ncbi:MAG TPA: hypothetical protein VFI38_13415 [Candidatus Acidoferrum sp.]|nr:hypothetical protein [Candidatus Acidoferrum sp.]